MSDLGFTLRRARELAGLTRKHVAGELGISAKTLERWEQANRARRPDAVRLAEVYDVDVDRLEFELAPARAAA